MSIRHGECGFCKQPDRRRCIADICRNIPLSNSSVGNFFTCHYLYYLTKIIGLETKPAFLPSAIKEGKLWDVVKQKHLGETISITDTINEYEINEHSVAKVRAVYHAYKELGIEVDPDYKLQAKVNIEMEIDMPFSDFIPTVSIGKEAIKLWDENKETIKKYPLIVNGFYDRKYSNYFAEDKFTSKPQSYLDIFFIQSQVGTYFLADPNLDYCIMEVVQVPQQRVLKEGKPNQESPESYQKRIYEDILSRPSNYFIGWNKEKKRYGKKFYRSEFDLEAIKSQYQQSIIEIMAARWNGNFYKNWKYCNNVFPGIGCSFQSVCRNNNVSENMYRVNKKI